MGRSEARVLGRQREVIRTGKERKFRRKHMRVNGKYPIRFYRLGFYTNDTSIEDVKARILAFEKKYPELKDLAG